MTVALVKQHHRHISLRRRQSNDDQFITIQMLHWSRSHHNLRPNHNQHQVFVPTGFDCRSITGGEVMLVVKAKGVVD